MLSLLLISLSAMTVRAAEPLAVLGVAAPPKVDAGMLEFLDEALASAASKALGAAVVDGAAISELLPPPQVKAAIKCDAPKCWRNFGEKLKVASLMSSRGIVSAAGLVLSVRVVRVADGRILARVQRTVALDPAAFSDGARAIVDELFPLVRAADPALWPAAGTVAAAPQAPAPTPIVAQTTAVATPSTTPVAVETTADIDPSFEYTAPPAPDLDVLLKQTRRVDNIWNAQWRAGLGFTVASAGAAGADDGDSGVQLVLPSISYSNIDETGMNLELSYLSLGPPEDRWTGDPAELPREVGVAMTLDFGGHWRERFDYLSTRFDFGFGFGFSPSLHTTVVNLGPELGILLHALRGTRGQALGLGPFVGGDFEMMLIGSEDPLAETRTQLTLNARYGLRFLGRPPAPDGESKPQFTFEGELYWRTVLKWLNDDSDATGGTPLEVAGKVSFLRLGLGILTGDDTYLKLFYDRRQSMSDDLNLVTASMSAAHMFTLSISNY